MSAHQLETIPVLTDALPVIEPGEEAAPAARPAAPTAPPAAPAGDAPLEVPVPPTAAQRDVETLIAELQTSLASSAFALTEELLREAFNEMEAKLYEEISGRLRRELPELIDTLLREHLGADRDS